MILGTDDEEDSLLAVDVSFNILYLNERPEAPLFENKIDRATGQTRLLALLKSVLLASDGPCLLVHPRNANGELQLRELADDWRRESDPGPGAGDHCLLMGFDLADGHQLVLTAIPAEAGGSEEPFNSTLLGFYVVNRSWVVMFQALEQSRIPLVLDIDETLVVANTATALGRKLADAKSRRAAHKHAYANANTHAEREAAAGLVKAVTQEEIALKEDLEWLEEFSESDCVTIDGHKEYAGLEIVDSSRQRPVIRRLDKGIIFTRIDPEVPTTSMAIRVRPGWEELRCALLGQDLQQPRSSLKFDIFICTTAQRAYALEVWRLLDPNHALLPAEIVPHRMINVNQNIPGTMKQLSGALGLGLLKSEPASPLPVAVIADDRTDVWVESAREQIARVEPYAPYRRALDLIRHVYAHRQHPRSIEWLSLIPLKDQLLKLRKNFYFDVNEILNKALLRPPEPLMRRLTWPQIRSMAEMIRDPDLRVPPPLAPGEEHLLQTGKPDIVIEVPAWVTHKNSRTHAAVDVDARMEDATPTWKFATAERPAAAPLAPWSWDTPAESMDTEAAQHYTDANATTDWQGTSRRSAKHTNALGDDRPKGMSKKKWKQELRRRALASVEPEQAPTEPATPIDQNIRAFSTDERADPAGGWEARLRIFRESQAGFGDHPAADDQNRENSADVDEAVEPAIGGQNHSWTRGGRKGGRQNRGGGRGFRGRGGGRDGGPGRGRGVQMNARRGRGGRWEPQRRKRTRSKRRNDNPGAGQAGVMPGEPVLGAHASGGFAPDPYSVWDRET